MTSTSIAGLRTGLFALLLAAGACATGQSSADADPNAPDADPNAPDADPSAPDATPVGTIDASISCPKSPCDLVQQCGCSSPQVCDLDNSALPTGGTRCRDVTTPGQDQATCSSLNGCAGGFVCLGSPGQCRRYCNGDSDCPGAGGLCLLTVQYDSGGGNFMDVPGAVVCTKDCQPHLAANNNCPAGYGCHIFLDDSMGDRFLTDCTTAPASGGGDDAPCTTSSNCQPGYDCIRLTQGGETSNLCKQNCVVASPSCDGGRTCTAFGDPKPIIGGVEYGVCL
jgi:hypothetical protein